MTKEHELLKKACAAIIQVYRTIGTPGDYGYNTPKGAALNELYNVNNEIDAALPSLSSACAAASKVLAELRDEVRTTLADLIECCTNDGDLDTAEPDDRADLDRLAEMVSRADSVLDAWPTAKETESA